jgi:hypothetical protein
LLDYVTHKEIYFSTIEEKPLFKYLGENFFDFRDNTRFKSPLTMVAYDSLAESTNPYFDRNNLKAGIAIYDAANFNNLKTMLAYYNSDINF